MQAFINQPSPEIFKQELEEFLTLAGNGGDKDNDNGNDQNGNNSTTLETDVFTVTTAVHYQETTKYGTQVIHPTDIDDLYGPPDPPKHTPININPLANDLNEGPGRFHLEGVEYNKTYYTVEQVQHMNNVEAELRARQAAWAQYLDELAAYNKQVA